MMEEKKEFEEYKMKLIWLEKDIICTSEGTGHSGEVIDPNDDPGGSEGPEIFD